MSKPHNQSELAGLFIEYFFLLLLSGCSIKSILPDAYPGHVFNPTQRENLSQYSQAIVRVVSKHQRFKIQEDVIAKSITEYLSKEGHFQSVRNDNALIPNRHVAEKKNTLVVYVRIKDYTLSHEPKYVQKQSPFPFGKIELSVSLKDLTSDKVVGGLEIQSTGEMRTSKVPTQIENGGEILAYNRLSAFILQFIKKPFRDS